MTTAVRGKRRTTTRKAAPRKVAATPDLSAEIAAARTEMEAARERAFLDTPFDTVVVERDDAPSETFEPQFAPFSGQDPEPWGPEPTPPQTEEFPHYYHAWASQLNVRKGRPEGFQFRGYRVFPRTAQQEANVRAYLKRVVPGGNPDRWMGDTPGFTRELRCPECGFFTSNLDVFDDHNQHTKHHIRIP